MSETDEVVQGSEVAEIAEVPAAEARPEPAEPPKTRSLASMKPRLAIAAGALCLVGWVALLGGLFAGIEVFSAGQAPALVLFALVTLAAASTLFARNAWTIVAFVAAVVYGTLFVYFRNGFDKTMPDALFYALVAAFYLTPPLTGVAAILAGTMAVRSERT